MASLYELCRLRERISILRAANEPLNSARAKAAFAEGAKWVSCPPDHPDPVHYFLEHLHRAFSNVSGLNPYNLALIYNSDPHPYTLAILRLELLDCELRWGTDKAPELAFSTQLALLARKPSSVSARGRGRPTEIDADTKTRALQCKREGGSNRDAAKIIYDTHWPSKQQVKNIPSILKHYQKHNKSKG